MSLCLLGLIALGCAVVPTATQASKQSRTFVSQSLPITEVRIGDMSWAVEVARTPSERAVGLGNRDHLPAGHGMLFILDDEQFAEFWMKDMRFALDVVWISSDLHVVGVDHMAAPTNNLTYGQLPRYPAPAPVKYVLEVNSGEAWGRHTQSGQQVRLITAVP